MPKTNNRPLKVYSGYTHISGKQHAACCAARSMAEVARIVGVSPSQIRGYWSETGNDEQVAAAMSSPSTLFVASINYPRKWRAYIRKAELESLLGPEE